MNDRVDIIGIGLADSKGIRRGVVNNVDSAAEAIKKALDEAELTAGVEIDTVSLALSGAHVKAFNSRGVVAVAGRNREITREDVKRAVDAFAKAVRSAATPDALLRDPAALDVILTANGLGDMVPRAAMARKALLSDLSDPKSLANTLTDPQWKQAAQTLDFARRGLAVVRDPRTAAKLADAEKTIAWLKNGAQPTERVAKILKSEGVLDAFAAQKGAQ